jgi:hypothetical protein
VDKGTPIAGGGSLTAREVFEQKDGIVTQSFYNSLNTIGPMGRLATALFRAQKRSSAAKSYKRGKFRHAAYDVKNWSLGEVCRLLSSETRTITWGWKRDPKTPGYEWVLYVELPEGQVSFHSPERGAGPDYLGEWDNSEKSTDRIIRFCDSISEVAA